MASIADGEGLDDEDDDVLHDDNGEESSDEDGHVSGDDDGEESGDDDIDEDAMEMICEQLLPMIVLIAVETSLPGVLPFYRNLPLHGNLPSGAASPTGAEYVDELFRQPHDPEFQEAFRMPSHTFLALEAWLGENTSLASSRHVDIKEKLAIFLFAVGKSSSNRDLRKRFQHSGDTISRIFNEVLMAMLRLTRAHVKLPIIGEPVRETVRNNPKFYPYFQDCLGALDGTLIKAHLTGWRSEAWIDRKRGLTQNVLAVVDFDMSFLYVLAGWEGSAVDMRVLQDAMNKGFSIPRGKYYLCDTGYINAGPTMCPYPDVP